MRLNDFVIDVKRIDCFGRFTVSGESTKYCISLYIKDRLEPVNLIYVDETIFNTDYEKLAEAYEQE